MSAMAAVKGGEMSGSSTTASRIPTTARGRPARTASSAKAKPRTVPVLATSAASSRLLPSARRCCQLVTSSRTAARVGPPSQKVSTRRRDTG
jgi:hypothetical protein